MNYISLRSVFAKTALLCTFFVLSAVLSLPVSGQTVTFAQFSQAEGGKDFIFRNYTTTGSFETIPDGSPIDFKYLNIMGLPAELRGFQYAHLTVSTTTTAATVTSGSSVSQPLNQTTTISIMRDLPAGVGVGTRRNLLTMVFSSPSSAPEITGTSGGGSATLSASTPTHNVTFYSDFISFATTVNRDIAFSFSSITPTLSAGAGNFLQSFAGNATGTFASDPPPVYGITAGDTILSGRVRNSKGVGVQNATVTLIESDGTTHQTRTTAAGYFRFPGIEAGQTVIVSVNSKRYTFTDRVISVQESLSDLEFVAER